MPSVHNGGMALFMFTSNRGQSKTVLTLVERGSKIARICDFDCQLAPVG